MGEFLYNSVLVNNIYIKNQNSVKDLNLQLKQSGFKPEMKSSYCFEGFGRTMMKSCRFHTLCLIELLVRGFSIVCHLSGSRAKPW